MAAASERIEPNARAERPPRDSSGMRTLLSSILIIAALCLLWEGLKNFSKSVDYALTVGETTIDLSLFNDTQLPHLGDILGAFSEPSQRNGPPLYAMLLENALYTLWAAVRGFFIGGAIGFILAILFAHSRLLQRGLLPYVVASQTVPILAIAPMVVIWMGRAGALEWSVPIIAAYLTFFPVTIYTLRGLTSIPPTALELMQSYAAGWWDILVKLRLPNALPQIFTALKISATASVVGAIIGELPSGIQTGLGIAILNFSRYYNQSPPRLFATILMAGLLGILFFAVIAGVERLVVRWRAEAAS
ncbi:MAG: ABC transporter permease [Anaerolineae bacterium]|nr:ABC transporter permease [Anaerolineae bacterium]NUQ06733.1 ABC transporter permease [Anaerolineae bacterium]